jgi:Ni/Co efflux regulator RcnB
MKTLLSTVCAATIAFGAVAPLQAAPMFVPKADTAATNVVQVNHTERHERRLERRERRMERRENRRERRAERREDRRDFRRAVRRGDYWYYNGYRGYDYYRPGYRRHGDFWFPLAAFAIIASQQPRVVVRDYGDSHVEWCYDRYRSYRAYDNTFQPYNGPRRQCYSPYS